MRAELSRDDRVRVQTLDVQHQTRSHRHDRAPPLRFNASASPPRSVMISVSQPGETCGKCVHPPLGLT
jgi:hypothetical protein